MTVEEFRSLLMRSIVPEIERQAIVAMGKISDKGLSPMIRGFWIECLNGASFDVQITEIKGDTE